MFNSWNQAFRTIGFLGQWPNINPAWCREQHGWLIWPYHIFPIKRCPGFMIITPSLSPYSIILSTQRFSTCSSTMDVGFVQLLLDCFCGNRIFKTNHEFSCHLCCSSSMILYTIQFNIQWSLSLSFGFQPLFLLADDVFPWFVHSIIISQTAALYRCSS